MENKYEVTQLDVSLHTQMVSYFVLYWEASHFGSVSLDVFLFAPDKEVIQFICGIHPGLPGGLGVFFLGGGWGTFGGSTLLKIIICIKTG